MVHSTVFSPVIICVVLITTGQISAIFQREGFDWKAICQQDQLIDIADDLKPLLIDFFNKNGCEVKRFKIERIIYSFNSNVGADNSQSRNWIQLVLNGERQLCYVSSFLGIIGRTLLNEDSLECFPFVCPGCLQKKIH